MCVCVCVCVCVCAQSGPTLWTLWTVACQASLSMEFSRQQILEWVTISSSRASSNPGIEPMSPSFAGGCFLVGLHVVFYVPAIHQITKSKVARSLLGHLTSCCPLSLECFPHLPLPHSAPTHHHPPASSCFSVGVAPGRPSGVKISSLEWTL